MPTKLHKKKYKYNSNITNTNGQKCYFNNMTSCCPHMPVNIKGQYAATENITLLNYMGNTYKLYTCCKMCGKQMTNLSENQFKKIYKPIIKNKSMFIHHRETGELIQRLPISKKYKMDNFINQKDNPLYIPKYSVNQENLPYLVYQDTSFFQFIEFFISNTNTNINDFDFYQTDNQIIEGISQKISDIIVYFFEKILNDFRIISEKYLNDKLNYTSIIPKYYKNYTSRLNNQSSTQDEDNSFIGIPYNIKKNIDLKSTLNLVYKLKKCLDETKKK